MCNLQHFILGFSTDMYIIYNHLINTLYDVKGNGLLIMGKSRVKKNRVQ